MVKDDGCEKCNFEIGVEGISVPVPECNQYLSMMDVIFGESVPISVIYKLEATLIRVAPSRDGDAQFMEYVNFIVELAKSLRENSIQTPITFRYNLCSKHLDSHFGTI